MSYESKIIRNTTTSDIELKRVGILIPALGQYVIEISEYTLWASGDMLDEIEPFLNSGDLVLNDGNVDLSLSDALRALEYPDRAYIQKDDVDVTRVNKVLNFEGSNVIVTDEGNGKATVEIFGAGDTLYWAKCVRSGSCEVLVQYEPLINQNCSRLKVEEC